MYSKIIYYVIISSFLLAPSANCTGQKEIETWDNLDEGDRTAKYAGRQVTEVWADPEQWDEFASRVFGNDADQQPFPFSEIAKTSITRVDKRVEEINKKEPFARLDMLEQLGEDPLERRVIMRVLFGLIDPNVVYSPEDDKRVRVSAIESLSYFTDLAMPSEVKEIKSQVLDWYENDHIPYEHRDGLLPLLFKFYTPKENADRLWEEIRKEPSKCLALAPLVSAHSKISSAILELIMQIGYESLSNENIDLSLRIEIFLHLFSNGFQVEDENRKQYFNEFVRYVAKISNSFHDQMKILENIGSQNLPEQQFQIFFSLELVRKYYAEIMEAHNTGLIEKYNEDLLKEDDEILINQYKENMDALYQIINRIDNIFYKFDDSAEKRLLKKFFKVACLGKPIWILAESLLSTEP